jgi:hypothetical protein
VLLTRNAVTTLVWPGVVCVALALTSLTVRSMRLSTTNDAAALVIWVWLTPPTL